MKKHIICLIKILCICPKLAFAQPWLGPYLNKNTSACYNRHAMNFLHDMHTVRHENKNLTAEEACLMVFDATRSAHPFSTCIYPSKKDFLSTLEIALLKVNNLNKDTHGTLEALKTLVNLLPDD